LRRSVRPWGIGVAAVFAILAAAFAALGLMTLAFIMLAVLAAGVVFGFVRERRHHDQVMTALNNMAQGLSMYDGRGRLVVCNDRYIEMSRLPPDNFHRGIPLRELLAKRAKNGTFSGDPAQYVLDSLKKAAEGLPEEKTVELKDGRTIRLTFRPLPGGGWVSTHTDVTQQHKAETERDSLRQNEERRVAIDVAIGGFRTRIENMLTTVGQSASAMKSAAKALLTTSDRTMQRAEARCKARTKRRPTWKPPPLLPRNFLHLSGKSAVSSPRQTKWFATRPPPPQTTRPPSPGSAGVPWV